MLSVALWILVALLALGPASSLAVAETPVYGYRVVNVYPHDVWAFTQGLVYDRGDLLEGTGLRGRSSLRRVDLETGAVLQQRDLASEFFGEGVALVDDRIYQLTWTSQKAFVYDRDSFDLLETFTYPTQGWGLTYDGRRLIMSDGSATLYFRDPVTFAEIGRVQVRDGAAAVTRLNELEYVKGEVWANVWLTDRVARIDPETGRVTGWIDLSGLLSPQEQAAADVLNGIAYDPQTDRVFVTGKLWPKLFEIELVSPHRLFFPTWLRVFGESASSAALR